MQNPLSVMKIRPLQSGHYNPLSNTFGMVRSNHTKPHQGWDLLAAPGTRVFAIANGELKAGVSVIYGRWLSLKFTYNSQTLFAFYAHWKDIVQSNVSVSEGALIALSGRTGSTAQAVPINEAHLHLEIRTIETIPQGQGLEGRIDPGEVLGYEIYSSST